LHRSIVIEKRQKNQLSQRFPTDEGKQTNESGPHRPNAPFPIRNSLESVSNVKMESA
jgi:hypothetical protein